MTCSCGGMMRLDIDDNPSCVRCGFVDYGPEVDLSLDAPGTRHYQQRNAAEISRDTLMAHAYRARGWSHERIARKVGVSRYVVYKDLKRTP